MDELTIQEMTVAYYNGELSFKIYTSLLHAGYTPALADLRTERILAKGQYNWLRQDTTFKTRYTSWVHKSYLTALQELSN